MPGGEFRPKAFAGEIVPFFVTAFREGHDLIGVHLRLFSPSGDESLHRLLPLRDGFDRWSALVVAARAGRVVVPLRGHSRTTTPPGSTPPS